MISTIRISLRAAKVPPKNAGQNGYAMSRIAGSERQSVMGVAPLMGALANRPHRSSPAGSQQGRDTIRPIWSSGRHRPLSPDWCSTRPGVGSVIAHRSATVPHPPVSTLITTG